jgi:hypothetical protein
VQDTFRHFWWLIFPLIWLVFGGMRLWMNYRSQQAWLEVVKTYAARGEVPPPELAAMARAGPLDPTRVAARFDRLDRCGPLGEWRRVIIFTALSGGFFIASFITDSGEAAQAFQVVATIMGVLAAAFGIMAILASTLARSSFRDEP